jgi:hypothetical protein
VAMAVIAEHPEGVIGAHLDAPLEGGVVRAGVGVNVLGGRRIVRQVRVGLGPLLDDDGVVALPVWWEDAEHPDLFPTFDGGLELQPAPEGTELRLLGSYEPPLGAFGRFADGVLGHHIVSASLEAFLTAVAERLVVAAAAVIRGSGPKPPP